jgi:hypothetical protein
MPGDERRPLPVRWARQGGSWTALTAPDEVHVRKVRLAEQLEELLRLRRRHRRLQRQPQAVAIGAGYAHRRGRQAKVSLQGIRHRAQLAPVLRFIAAADLVEGDDHGSGQAVCSCQIDGKAALAEHVLRQQFRRQRARRQIQPDQF